jgi:hypothetical protein
MYATIEFLRDITRRCLAGEPLSLEQCEWLGRSFARFLDRRCRSVDEALGLRFPQGGVPWWQEEAIRKRNAALQELAARFFRDLPPNGQAKAIGMLTSRYAASAWPRERERESMPTHYHDTPKQYIWAAFKAGAAMPLSRRQLWNILSGLGTSKK